MNNDIEADQFILLAGFSGYKGMARIIKLSFA